MRRIKLRDFLLGSLAKAVLFLFAKAFCTIFLTPFCEFRQIGNWCLIFCFLSDIIVQNYYSPSEVNMKKILALMLCLLFCVGTFAGCSSLDDDEKGANVCVFLTDYPQTLDPALVQVNSDVDQILSLIYEPLTIIDEDGKVVGGLAESWYYEYDDIYEEHNMYFELKETMWSDNRSVSADDVIYAWRRILDPATESPYAALLYPIKNAKRVKSGIDTYDDLGLAAEDDTLLKVTFETEYDVNLFAETVANIHLAPCREDIVTRYEKEGEDWASSGATIVCNGKFKVQTMDMDATGAYKLVLERNAYYMREEEDALDKYVLPYRITCYYYEGQTDWYDTGMTQTQFQANRFLAGEIYYLSKFDAETFNYFASGKDYDLVTNATTNGFAFYFNNANEILSDAKVRNAFSLALDRGKLVSEVLGTGEIAATGYVPKGVFDTDRKTDFRTVGGDLYNISGDVDGAKALIREASKKSGTLTLVYLIPESAATISKNKRNVTYDNYYKKIADYAAGVWEELGYTIELKGLHPDEYLEALYARDYDIIGINICENSTDAFAYLAPFATEYSGAAVSISVGAESYTPHYTNFQNDEYNAIIDSIVYVSDRAQRATTLHQAEQKLVELCPAAMVFWYSNSYVASDSVKGYDSDSWFGYTDFTDLSLSDWRDINAAEDELSNARNSD